MVSQTGMGSCSLALSNVWNKDIASLTSITCRPIDVVHYCRLLQYAYGLNNSAGVLQAVPGGMHDSQG